MNLNDYIYQLDYFVWQCALVKVIKLIFANMFELSHRAGIPGIVINILYACADQFIEVISTPNDFSRDGLRIFLCHTRTINFDSLETH